MEQWGKWLVIAGMVLAIIGLVLWLGGDRWSWLGRLHGDIRIERDNFRFYFPITTLVLINLLIWLIWWLLRKFF